MFIHSRNVFKQNTFQEQEETTTATETETETIMSLACIVNLLWKKTRRLLAHGRQTISNQDDNDDNDDEGMRDNSSRCLLFGSNIVC